MSLMTRRALGVAALLVLVSSASAWAGAPTERLRTFFDEANRVLTAPETHTDPLEALGRVKRLVNDVFDFGGAAEQALGPAWQARSRAERDEFTALFAELLQKNFVGRVATKARMDGGLTVRYLDEQIEGDTATVRTAVEARDSHELRLEYRMVKRWPRGWTVRDVAMDGVGLLANYQAQFARLLHSGSYAELVAQMRAKAQPSPELLAQLAEPEELPPSAAPAAVVAAAPPSPPVVTTPAPAPSVAAVVPSSARASAPAPMPPAETRAPTATPARAAAECCAHQGRGAVADRGAAIGAARCGRALEVDARRAGDHRASLLLGAARGLQERRVGDEIRRRRDRPEAHARDRSRPRVACARGTFRRQGGRGLQGARATLAGLLDADPRSAARVVFSARQPSSLRATTPPAPRRAPPAPARRPRARARASSPCGSLRAGA